LLAAAMFSDPEPGREFYLESLLPTFRTVVESIIPAITGWPLKAFEVDVFAQSMLGIHLGIAFDALLDESPIDVSSVARQVTVMFAQSMLGERGRTSSKVNRNDRSTSRAEARRRTSKVVADLQPATRKRLPAAERRVKIIAAARDAFLHDSMNGARTKDIAERAGVTEAFLYRYFDSKEAMYEAAVLEPLRMAIAALTDDLTAINDEVDDPVEFVRKVHRRCLEYFVNYARLQSIALFAEIGNGREFYAESVRPRLDPLGELLAKHTGWEVRGIDPVVVRRCALGAQFVVGLDHAFRQDPIDLDVLANELTVLFTGGIKEKPAVAAERARRSPARR
jgi:AcrR family transcriptional regulator